MASIQYGNDGYVFNPRCTNEVPAIQPGQPNNCYMCVTPVNTPIPFQDCDEATLYRYFELPIPVERPLPLLEFPNTVVGTIGTHVVTAVHPSQGGASGWIGENVNFDFPDFATTTVIQTDGTNETSRTVRVEDLSLRAADLVLAAFSPLAGCLRFNSRVKLLLGASRLTVTGNVIITPGNPVEGIPTTGTFNGTPYIGINNIDYKSLVGFVVEPATAINTLNPLTLTNHGTYSPLLISHELPLSSSVTAIGTPQLQRNHAQSMTVTIEYAPGPGHTVANPVMDTGVPLITTITAAPVSIPIQWKSF